jgi:hypothetical protein
LKRIIVFSSREEVPHIQVFPAATPEGWGCLVISNAGFKISEPLLKKKQLGCEFSIEKEINLLKNNVLIWACPFRSGCLFPLLLLSVKQ